MAVKRSNLKLDRILWVDLEMTGLSPEDDLILEVAAIITDWKFKEIATYEGIIKNTSRKLKKRFDTNEFWKENPELRQALESQNEDGKSLCEIEQELIKFVDKYFKIGKPVLLAGNSIHMDRRFIVEKWPKLDEKLFYRMLDVSAWKVVFEYKYKKPYVKENAHRALDDIRGSIAELQYYLDKVK